MGNEMERAYKLISILMIALSSLCYSCTSNEPKPMEQTKEENNEVEDWEEIIVDEDSYTIDENSK